MAIGSIRRLVRLANSSSDQTQRTAVAALSALFIFELLLTFKQGSLLSCTYTFAYAMLLQKLATHAEARSPTTVEGLDGHSPAIGHLFSNLMR
jgi:hypothetical protein